MPNNAIVNTASARQQKEQADQGAHGEDAAPRGDGQHVGSGNLGRRRNHPFGGDGFSGADKFSKFFSMIYSHLLIYLEGIVADY